jgi:predicted aconitase
VIGITPVARTYEDAFLNEKPGEIVELEEKDLKEVREKYSTEWNQNPKNIAIGCPQLSKEEVTTILKRLKGKVINPDLNFWICTNEDVKEFIRNSEYSEILENSGAKLTSFCPSVTALPRPFVTNSAKTCFYTNATYRDLNACIKIATEGYKNV